MTGARFLVFRHCRFEIFFVKDLFHWYFYPQDDNGTHVVCLILYINNINIVFVFQILNTLKNDAESPEEERQNASHP